MTYDEFISRVIITKNENPDWRWGQTYYIVLWKVNADLATNIHLSEADPFYQDSRIPEFLAQVHAYFSAFGSVTDERPGD